LDLDCEKINKKTVYVNVSPRNPNARFSYLELILSPQVVLYETPEDVLIQNPVEDPLQA
jgi:hypothetical protein